MENTSIGNRDSPYDARSRNRNKIRIATWNSLGVSDIDGSPKHRCRNCFEQWKMILKEIDGQKVYWCHGCDQSMPAEPSNSESSNTKYQNKYGTAQGKSNSMIISKDNKKKPRPGQLSELDGDDLNRAFGSSAGVSLINERTDYYQDS